MKIQMRFEGGAELAKTLDQLSVRLQKTVMRDALYEGGELIRARGEEFAPHDPGPPDLRDNIGMSVARVREAGDSAAIKIGPVKGFAYGLPQEIGTQHHPAQPFMRPAFHSEVARSLSVIGASLWRALIKRKMVSSSSVSEFFTGGDLL